MNAIGPERLRRIEDWFAGFVRPFARGDRAARQNWSLKRSHTLRVRKIAAGLAKGLGLSAAETRTVEAIALLHDVGRFPQFRRHRTLYDRRSEDHAALGRRIVREAGVLRGLAHGIRKTVLRSIFLHNKASLPRGEDPRVLFYTRIIRDADKIDNLSLISRYYSRPRKTRIHAFELGLEEGPEIADQFFEDIRAGKTVSLKRLKTIGELKLLVAGWIHDINFPASFRRVRQGRCLELLRRSYPPSKRIDAVFASLEARLAAGCRTTNSANYEFRELTPIKK